LEDGAAGPLLRRGHPGWRRLDQVGGWTSLEDFGAPLQHSHPYQCQDCEILPSELVNIAIEDMFLNLGEVKQDSVNFTLEATLRTL